MPPQPPTTIARDDAEALRGEVRALGEAIDRLATKLDRETAPPEPPPTLRRYANENTGAITLLALIVAIAFGIAAVINSVNADLRQAGRWLLLLTTAAALTIGFELIGAGLHAIGMAWDTVAEQGLEQKPKVVSIAAALRLTIFVGLIAVSVVFVGLLGLATEPTFSLGFMRYFVVPVGALLLLPEVLGRWATWAQNPRSRLLRITGTLIIVTAMLLTMWFVITL